MLSPVVLALDFGGSKIAAAVADAATGVRLGDATIPTVAADGAQANLTAGIEAGQRLVDRAAPGRRLAAVGACTFGIPTEDGVQLAPAVPGWGDLRLGHELRRAFAGAEVRLATDVKAAAQAEAEWGALAGCDPGIYLNLGTGLAAAIVVGGTVLTGRHGAAGEIGYNLRQLPDVGRPLTDRIPLEDAVSGIALRRDAVTLAPATRRTPAGPGPADSADLLPAPGTGAAAVFAAAATEPRAADRIRAFGTELAFHLVNLAIAIDPVRIAVGGGMVRSWEQLHGRLRAALDAAVPFPPELVVAAFPHDAPLLGALALATAAARAAASEEATA
ncbi:MAG TPA: ROK family protein [Mycobacteriales bacterium]|nr:ROK family protein [Mycobacteriales bacterium]